MNHRRATPSKPTKALTRIVKKSDAQHQENTERLVNIAHEMGAMAKAMSDHISADAAAFAAQNLAILEVNKDVKSLLHSRSFLRGTWFAVVTVGTLIGVVAGLVVAWYK